jgi:site-specific recombinase XerD
MDELVAASSILVTHPEPPQFIQATPVQPVRAFPVLGDLLALPEKLSELPDWLQIPLGRYLRLKQRNWPAKTVQRSTRQLFNRLWKMIDFFTQNYGWTGWEQVSSLWLEDYIDAKLREALTPASINWDLIFFRSLGRFLLEEGYNIPKAMTQMPLLDEPRRLPRPLPDDQVRRLEQHLLAASSHARTAFQKELAVRDLACFYLLWHCGLRTSEVCSLQIEELDLEGRKLFIRNSKEGKDRMVYLSDTATLGLRRQLESRSDQHARYVFPTRQGALLPRDLQRRLVKRGGECGVAVTAQRLRHTFASQMLASGMPVTSLQRYLGHEDLDTTMLYAQVADPLLQKDYYHGVSAVDPASAHLGKPDTTESVRGKMQQLIVQLQTPDLAPERKQEITDQMQLLLDLIE